jgi:hypothetical protein
VSGLVDFLNLRLDEDELYAQAAGEADDNWVYRRLNKAELTVVDATMNARRPDGGIAWHPGPDKALSVLTFWEEDGEHLVRWQPRRVRLEIAAKRKFIEQYAPPDPHKPGKCPDCDMLYAFAAIHSDHPDYRQEWAL